MAQDSSQAKYSEQNILNNVYDQVFKTLAVMGFKWDGQNGQYPIADTMAIKKNIVVDGSVTTIYLGIAAPGTAQDTPKWQVSKNVIDSTDSTNISMVTTWAGNGAFNQVATDLSSLDFA